MDFSIKYGFLETANLADQKVLWFIKIAKHSDVTIFCKKWP